jgi:hypothetical protein
LLSAESALKERVQEIQAMKKAKLDFQATVAIFEENMNTIKGLTAHLQNKFAEHSQSGMEFTC